MGALMKAYDWSQTPLGPVSQWPQSLKTSVRIILTSRQPMFVWWGKELINLYNDAYKAIVGGKHPKALGQPASVVWQEIWDRVGPRAESAMLNNEGTYDEALLLIMERNGYPEETYYTFSYSPVPNDQGETGGIICANTDDTQRIIGERQLALLRELGARTADARTFDDACRLSASSLATNPYDITFAMIYLVDLERRCVDLAGTSGIDRSLVPETVSFDSDSIWPFAEVINTQKAKLVSDWRGEERNFPTGAWQQPTHQAIVKPILPSGQTGKSGILIAGLNPFRLFDDKYRGFIKLVAAQISASISNAQAYEQERQRAEALAELDRTKTAFFSNVSHEFRTPLTLMLAPLEEILPDCSSLLPPEHCEQLQMVHRNGLRLLKLVNTLLDFSRLEAGRMQAVYEPIDLAVLTSDLAGVFRSAIEGAGMRLLVDCSPISQPVYVDKEMWEKIVFNLLSNAFKFTLKGEIAVIMRSNGDRIELEVRDTGTGIPANELSHIFERFHRVEGAKGRSYEGSGIGLSLVRELVRLHGGTIEVNSVVERGTSFTVSIPTGYAHLPSDCLSTTRTLTSTTTTGATPYVEEVFGWLPEEVREQEGKDLPQPFSISAPRLLRSSAYSGRILLVDDNTDMRDYVKRLLSDRGYEVETAVDGIAALTAVRQQVPDLVLTDVMMPRLDGFGLLRELRSDAIALDVPIILLSARAGEEARIEGLEAGADDYLIKPFSARELLARVEATLKLAQLRRNAREREQALQLEAAANRADFEQVISSLRDGFVTFDRDWRYTYVNDRQLEIFKLDREAVMGQNLWEVFPDIVGTESYDRLHRAMNEQIAVQFEFYYPRLNCWIEHRVYPTADGIAILVADITQRKQAEEALQQISSELERQLRKMDAISSSVTDFIYTFDLSGNFTYVNQPLLDLWQKTATEAFGKNFFDLDYPRDLATRLQRQIQQVIETRQPLKDETPYTSAFSTRAYEYVLVPIFSANGIVEAVAGITRDITDRKQAEELLRQSEERFRSMADNAPMMVWVTDAQGYCTYLNQSWYDFTGQTEETGLGFGWLDIVHPDDYEYTQEIFLAANERQEAFRLEYRLQSKNGEYHWMIDAASPWFEGDGQFKGYIGSVIDISDRKKIEEALQQRETELRLVTNAVPALISFVDSDQRYRFNNRGYEQWFGHSATELYGKHIKEVLGDTAYEEIRPYVEQVLAGQQVSFEMKMPNKNGETRYLTVAYVPRLSSDGTVEGFVALVNDISDLKLTEQSLHESLAILKAIDEATPILIYMKDRQGRLRIANPATLSFLGKSASEVIGKTEVDFYINQDEAIPVMENDRQVMKTGQVQMFEETMELPGGIRTFLSVKAPYRDVQGATIGLIGVSTEITERKQLQTEREQLLAREQAAREAAETANRIKDEFLAVVSHELRSPLNPILGWSKLLRTRQFDRHKTEQALEIIERNALMQAQLIDDLLDVSRILRGKLSLNASSVDLGATIQAAIETVRLAAQAKSIEIHTCLDPEVGYVWGDPGRLQQVVWNFLSNAVKFTPEGGRVDIRLEEIDGHAQITISDTGKGIHPNFLPYVFDHFRQEDAAITRRFGGLGLGLAIVRYLVELHGGTVQAESAGEGQGATFTLKLPLMPHLPPTERELESSQPPLDLKGIRIMVVDDDDSSREFVAFLLELHGASVSASASAKEAISTFPQFKPDVLLSDIGMPDRDGYMLIQQIRALPPNQGGQIPAIALTAYAGDLDRQQALQAGFQQHLTKPIEPNQLVQVITTLVSL
ncbi:diguanylate cyclase [Merismopedia glauca CCAP 1448/3]|uniref:histidine kinase n=2 Tax=Merismopedia TaxID=53402 RepID=A0A2T1C4Q9_9CYAN|nr:diguanylate cyclase [Merismopedia glauca CCAP 1448/3]